MEGEGVKGIHDAARDGDRAHRDGESHLRTGFCGTALLPSPHDIPLLPAPGRAAQGDVGPLWGILAATSGYCWPCPAAEEGTGEGTRSAGPTHAFPNMKAGSDSRRSPDHPSPQGRCFLFSLR